MSNRLLALGQHALSWLSQQFLVQSWPLLMHCSLGPQESAHKGHIDQFSRLWVRRRDRRTDGRTPDRYVTLSQVSAIDAVNVINQRCTRTHGHEHGRKSRGNLGDESPRIWSGGHYCKLSLSFCYVSKFQAPACLHNNAVKKLSSPITLTEY